MVIELLSICGVGDNAVLHRDVVDAIGADHVHIVVLAKLNGIVIEDDVGAIADIERIPVLPAGRAFAKAHAWIMILDFSLAEAS